MVVSIPEKTLEHWASIYLTYRYRSHAALWWPAHGEDINVGNLPPIPGKAIQLELKTTYLNSAGTIHRVNLSLRQLDRYLRRPHGERPIYVFPRPSWTGELELAAPADGVPATEVGFRRADVLYYSALTWWFAEWLQVLTTDQVAAIVHPQLAAYRAGGATPDSVTLVTFDLAGAHLATTWADGNQRRAVSWLQFWDRLNQCGRPSWHQLVRLPATLLPRAGRIPHADMPELLAQADERDSELVTLGSGAEGVFGPIDQAPVLRDTDGDRDGDGSVGQDLDHRIVAFLGLGALRLE